MQGRSWLGYCLALLVVGCVAAPGVHVGHGKIVRVTGGKYRGTGAVVGRNLVATVAHVGTGTLRVEGYKARVVKEIRTKDYESLIILKVSTEWSDLDRFRISTNSPRTIYTRRGKTRPSQVIRGDSGSPVVDRWGRLAGHVSATVGGRYVIVTRYPATDSLR